MQTYNNLQSVKNLAAYYEKEVKGQHLREMLKDGARNAALRTHSESSNLYFDFTHEKMDAKCLDLLKEVAVETQVFSKIEQMYKGERINITEGRSVLHVALRKP